MVTPVKPRLFANKECTGTSKNTSIDVSEWNSNNSVPNAKEKEYWLVTPLITTENLKSPSNLVLKDTNWRTVTVTPTLTKILMKSETPTNVKETLVKPSTPKETSNVSHVNQLKTSWLKDLDVRSSLTKPENTKSPPLNVCQDMTFKKLKKMIFTSWNVLKPNNVPVTSISTPKKSVPDAQKDGALVN